MILYARQAFSPLDPACVFCGFAERDGAFGGCGWLECMSRYQSIAMPSTLDEVPMGTEASMFMAANRSFRDFARRVSKGSFERGRPKMATLWTPYGTDVVYSAVRPMMVPVSPSRRCPFQYEWLEEALDRLVKDRRMGPAESTCEYEEAMRGGIAIPDFSRRFIGDLDARDIGWNVLDGIYRNVLGSSPHWFYVFPPEGAVLPEGASMFVNSEVPRGYCQMRKVHVTQEEGFSEEDSEEYTDEYVEDPCFEEDEERDED